MSPNSYQPIARRYGGTTVNQSQSLRETFSAYMASLTPAVSLRGNEPMIVLQGGVAKQVPANAIAVEQFTGGSLSITRAQIPSVAISTNAVVVSGYTTAGDFGAGAIYTSVGATSGGPGAIQDLVGTWLNLVVIPPVSIGFFGAKMNGTTDDSAAIQACLTATNQAWIPPNVSVGINSKVNVRSNQSFFGSGPTSVLVPLNVFAASLFIDIAGDKIAVKDFAIASSQPDTHVESNHAFIENSAAVTNLTIDNITVNSPTQRTGFINIIVGSGQSASVIAITNCRMLACDAGITLFGTDEISTIKYVVISDNYLANTFYQPAAGSGVSLSANISQCLISNNIIGNHNLSCIELVGTLDGISVIGNTFFGATTPRSIVSSNVFPATDVLIADNVCSADFAGVMNLAAVVGANICNNYHRGGIHFSNDNHWIHDNVFITPANTHSPYEYEGGGVYLDGRFASCAGCLVENNIIDVSNSPSLTWALVCAGASSTGNVIRGNVYKRDPQGYSYEAEVAGAASNLFYNNQLELTGPVDNPLPGPTTVFQFVAGTTYTVQPTDVVLQVNSVSTLTLTMPSAADFPLRVIYIFTIGQAVNSATNDIANLSGVQVSSILSASAGKWAILISDGAALWRTVAAN